MQIVKPEGSLAAAVFLVITRLARELQVRQPPGLTASEVGVLSLLEDGPGSPVALAAAEGISPPSMSRHLAALKVRGLVSQADHPADRRQVVLELTASGREALAAARAGGWLTGKIGELDERQQDKLREALPVLGELHMTRDAKHPQ